MSRSVVFAAFAEFWAGLPETAALCAINEQLRSKQTAATTLARNVLRIFSFSLCVNSALANRVSDTIDRQHISRNAVVHMVRFRVTNHVIEGCNHDRFQLLIHERFFPEIALPVLHPFEVGSRHATGIAQD